MVNLEQEEKIRSRIKKHWLIIALEGLFIFLFALAPLVAIMIGGSYFDLKISYQAFLFGLFFYLIWLIFAWILFFLAWTDYFFDIWIVTNERIIDIEQKGVFNREVSSIRLDRIQDITVEVVGILPTLLSFGDIHVQSAGRDRKIIFKNAANPYQAKENIGSLLEGIVPKN